MEKQHDFDTSYAAGILGEEFLDSLFDEHYEIEQVSRAEQRRGIDRYFTNRHNHSRFPVEYKTDTRAAATGNAFIETMSVDTAGKAGWSKTSEAKYLLYYIPGMEIIYCLELDIIRDCLHEWQEVYRTAIAHNDGYDTHGLLVPLGELEMIARWKRYV